MARNDPLHPRQTDQRLVLLPGRREEVRGVGRREEKEIRGVGSGIHHVAERHVWSQTAWVTHDVGVQVRRFGCGPQDEGSPLYPIRLGLSLTKSYDN